MHLITQRELQKAYLDVLNKSHHVPTLEEMRAKQLRRRLAFSVDSDTLRETSERICFNLDTRSSHGIIDISPINEVVGEYVNEGYKIFGYRPSIYFSELGNNKPISEGKYDVLVNSMSLDDILKLIINDIADNKDGRVFAIIFEYDIFRHEYLYFAFHPDDKDHPLLKDIWVDVYK